MIQTLQAAAGVGAGGAGAADAMRGEPASLLWGLTATELHDAFWRAKGVQCVRRGQRQTIERAAELYLLLEPAQLVVFDIADPPFRDRLVWHNALITRLRLLDESQHRYAEHVVVNDRGLVQRIERRYGAQVRGSSRVMLARSRRVASMWMSASRSRREGWDRVRRAVPWARVDHWKCVGRTFIAGQANHEAQMIDDLVERWPYPNQSITDLQESSPSVWHRAGETIAPGVVRIGPLWLGQGAGEAQQRCLVGPAWLGDCLSDAGGVGADVRPRRSAALRDIADVQLPEESTDETVDIGASGVYHAAKRAFDVFVSGTALLILFPVMAAVACAVWMEDGGALFFGHNRQGRGGRVFKCWKFRTMRENALAMARQLADQNQCDGPQVNIRNDPRVTRVGRVLRKCHLDELPQFWNVLRGDMSLVGPRPSPDDENQYCPAWRDLRLSVRPGITGLWQLERRREPGEDFQEWIKYDIAYVQRASLWFDLTILFRTALMLVRGRSSRASE
jgi:lipopolysaccharide/colanic/teichoic acid biosynthesis glycosyltransferase